MKIRNYFATGFLIALPAFFTLYLLYVVFRFIDGVFGKLINIYFQKHFGFAIPGAGLVIGFLVIFLIGFTAKNFFGKRLIHALERWFLRFPFIRFIYPPAKQIVDSFTSKESPAFKKVVLVQYPCEGIWSIGFLTNDSFRDTNEKSGQDLVHIFIATTPSPLTGFLILVPRNSVKDLDISVEDGIKLIISAGIVKPAISQSGLPQ